MAPHALPRTLVALALAGTVVATAVVSATAAPRTTAHHSAHSAHSAYPEHPAHSTTQQALDAITRAGTPGALARVDHADEATWHGTSGVADLRTGRPRLPQDRFRIGSLAKPFIATVLLQLAAEPRYGLSLDDSVDTWLPGLVRGNGNDGREITLRHLLQHTSGLYDYLRDPQFRAKFTGDAFYAHRYEGATPAELVAVGLAHEPLFKPGGGWSYSNTNYTLVGMVIEKATGNSYASEVERRLIKPLGLRGTTLPGSRPTVPGPHGRHYSKLFVTGPDARTHDVTDFNPSVAWTGGEIISTARDLNVFISALLRGELLPPAQQKEMFTARELTNGRSYGLGIESKKLPGCDVTVWGHSGDIFGSLTRTAATADGQHVMTINRNSDWGDDALEDAAVEAEFCAPGHR